MFDVGVDVDVIDFDLDVDSDFDLDVDSDFERRGPGLLFYPSRSLIRGLEGKTRLKNLPELRQVTSVKGATGGEHVMHKTMKCDLGSLFIRLRCQPLEASQ